METNGKEETPEQQQQELLASTGSMDHDLELSSGDEAYDSIEEDEFDDFAFVDEPPPSSTNTNPNPSSFINTDGHEFVIQFGTSMHPLQLPKNSTVRDLKNKIWHVTNVKTEEQKLHGLPKMEGIEEAMFDQLPLEALPLDSIHNLLMERLPPKVPLFSQGDFGTSPSGAKLTVDAMVKVLDSLAVDFGSFTAEFEEKYGSVHPIFTCGLYSDAMKVSRDTFRLMILNIHSDFEENDQFCKDVLTNPGLPEFLATHFIFWVGKAEKARIAEVSACFGFPLVFPFIAIMGPVHGSFSVLEVIQGETTADSLLSKLYHHAYAHEPELEKARTAARVQQEKRRLLEDQDMAFKLSLQQDREKERKRKMEEEREQKLQNERRDLVKTARQRAIDDLNELGEEKKGAIIAVKLVDGSRIKRGFAAEDKFEKVLAWIKGTVASRLDDVNFLDDSSAPIDDDGELIPWNMDAYELISNFPKKSFGVQDKDKSLKEMGLAPQAMLFLHRKC